VRHQPCQRISQDRSTHPAAVRISEHGPASHTLPLAMPVVQQPKLANSNTGQPQGLTNDPANRKTSIQPGARVHRVKPMFLLHPVTGQPRGLRQSPQQKANDNFQYMFDANHIKSKNSNLEIHWMWDKANLERRRDGTKRAIEGLEDNVRNKKFDIELAHFRKYVFSLFQIESSSSPCPCACTNPDISATLLVLSHAYWLTLVLLLSIRLQVRRERKLRQGFSLRQSLLESILRSIKSVSR
jgi:hypothetical protein